MGAEQEVQKLRSDLGNWQGRLREAESEVAGLQAQFEDVESRLAIARADEEIYRKLTEGTEALLARLVPSDTPPVPSVAPGAGVSDESNGQPRGREAILRVMDERSGEWEQMDIVRAIMERGWIDPNAKTPKEAIRVAIKRLVDRGELERLRPGVLRRPAATSLLNEEEVPAM